MAEKKDFFENFEVLIGSVIRPQFKSFFFANMDRLKMADLALWKATTWMYRTKPSTFGTFRVFLLGAATAAERVLDWFGTQSGIFGQLVDKIGVALLEDIDSLLDEYSKMQSNDEYVGYNGPKDNELKEMAGRLKAHFKKWSVQYIHRLPTLLEFRADSIFGGPGWVFGQTLLIQSEEVFQKFKRWWEEIDERTRSRFYHVLSAINNGGEFAAFLMKTPADMTFFINIQYETKKRRFIDPEAAAEAGRFYNATVGATARSLGNEIEGNTDRLRSETDDMLEPAGTSFTTHWFITPAAIGLMLISLATTPWGQSFRWSNLPWMQVVMMLVGLGLFLIPRLIQLRLRLNNLTQRQPEARVRVIS